MTDLGRKDAAGPVQIVGRDENYMMDVELIDGKRRALTSSIVIIEQLFGRDNYADTWFYIGDQYDSSGAGAIGDTVRVFIAQGPDPSYEEIDITYTLVAEDVGDEITLADNIVKYLNANLLFRDKWKSSRVKDNSVVHIGSKLAAEFGERPNGGDFQVYSTGTTIVTSAWDKVVRQGKSTSLSRDSRDPRVGILGISGTVSVTAGAVDNIYQEDLIQVENPPNTALNIDGDPVPGNFRLDALVGYDLFIEEIRFHGVAGSIKYGQFLNINSVLDIGIEIEIKSDDGYTMFQPIQSTEDFKSRWSSLGGWDLDITVGGDHFLGTRRFDATALPVLRAADTYTTNDFLNVRVSDDIDSVGEFYCTVIGFRKEP